MMVMDAASSINIVAQQAVLDNPNNDVYKNNNINHHD